VRGKVAVEAALVEEKLQQPQQQAQLNQETFFSPLLPLPGRLTPDDPEVSSGNQHALKMGEIGSAHGGSYNYIMSARNSARIVPHHDVKCAGDVCPSPVWNVASTAASAVAAAAAAAAAAVSAGTTPKADYGDVNGRDDDYRGIIGFVRVEVVDTGAGISKVHLSKKTLCERNFYTETCM
jgi:hypothetical protein